LRAILTGATLAIAAVLAGAPSAFATENRPTPGSAIAAPAVVAEPPPASPGLDLTQPSPTADPPDKPLVKRWWFWTVVGTALAASVLVLVVADRHPPAPGTTLGNQEFRP